MSWGRYVRGAAAGLLLALAGCATVTPREAAVVAHVPPPAPDARVVPVLAAEGLKHLRENRLDEASRIFNAGLKLVPDSAQLHFLNGFTYHLMYLRGGEAMRELAAIGYELALAADPSHYHAALQLGRLELQARRPDKAQATSTSHGINLLNGLSYVLNQSRAVTDVLATVAGATAAPQTRTTTITRTRGAGLPASGIQYSLNIANASDSRNEVLARPSLVALDRRPSTFFSGKNLTLGIAGQAGGSSAFADKPIGVSLSVTPTFIDADTMLVAVRAARSFIEEVDFSVAFPQSLQASRNSVSANVVLKFGQTLILSGLTEQEVERAVSGVPVLQEIPVLQYFFRAKTSQRFTRSVLVVLTPRRPVLEAEPVRLEEALDGARRHARENGLWLQFRSGDLRNDEWTRPPRLQSLLRQLGELLYF